ncbi:hypothetical protein GOBAR_DD12472 [Gossypium barbadense]|nr:hypothetical protein GOBAR_DD12472 [Gossypium barbadense]
MRPNQHSQPPAVGGSSSANRNRPRRLAELTVPLPQRTVSLPVPLPLPPASNAARSTCSNGNANSKQVNLSEIDRVNRIGSGAGGTVYKVIHRPSSRLYALKVIYGNHEETVRRQIRREIEILRDVNHPNVVKCHEMYDQNGEIQVLLEFMDVGSLEGTHISHESNLSDLARQILNGLNYLHRRHIVHRDIKPSNLLINSKKKVKIADFGVSRILDQTMHPCNSSVGTVAYMSPERINTDLNQGQYDGYAGDIWSLGVSILEFYLGRFPFAVGRQGDWASLMCAICLSQPPEAPPTASYEFRHFISCCLQKDPTRRLTAAQLLQHPFIIRGQNQVLLEFMDVGSLEGTHISHESNLSDLARQILNGLNYLHRRHIVHRDIKPSNLLINSKKKVKIADFGVSRILDQTMHPCNSSVGTVAYMSPERINTDLNQGQYDGYAGDIWSLGVSILEFYLGRFPFAVGRQGDWASLMCAICLSQPPEAPPTASYEFRHFISCCLQKDPTRRLTAAQLLQHPFIIRGQNQVAQNLHQLLPPPPLSS